MKFTKGQNKVIDADSHLLVKGGPGSGKTTIAILKAVQIAEKDLRPGQNILFLSFARSTVSRVAQALNFEQQISAETKRLIEIDTYHAFFWRLLKTHGYLIGLPRKLNILAPQHEAIVLSGIRSNYSSKNLTNEQTKNKKADEFIELNLIAKNKGRVAFDLFAKYVGSILNGSERLRHLVAARYPVLILDEFQDTSDSQWNVVQALGQSCRLIALADPEQRIYDWLETDPQRLDHFSSAFNPKIVDLSKDNHRSRGTEIAIFGDDLLTGEFRQKNYKGIAFKLFDTGPNPKHPMVELITTIYAARKRLVTQNIEDWSLAILVPTKEMTRQVSAYLNQPPSNLKSIQHTAIIDMEGTILASELLGFLMQPTEKINHFSQFIDLICNYFQGNKGGKKNKEGVKKAKAIRTAFNKQIQGNKLNSNSILHRMLETYNLVCSVRMTGDPNRDWVAIRDAMTNGTCKSLKGIAEEVKNIRLLDRGTQLRQQLSQDWLENRYSNALKIFQKAFVQEYFSSSTKIETGVIVMNMHKAKGKQFDEVIVFEGWPRKKNREIVANLNRIVRWNTREQITNQARQNLRVSVTRAKLLTTILTPRDNPCVLFTGLNKST